MQIHSAAHSDEVRPDEFLSEIVERVEVLNMRKVGEVSRIQPIAKRFLVELHVGSATRQRAESTGRRVVDPFDRVRIHSSTGLDRARESSPGVEPTESIDNRRSRFLSFLPIQGEGFW